ncbi:MAG: T9SS type A sorting domain-containing protein [Bacteroidota bacterium]
MRNSFAFLLLSILPFFTFSQSVSRLGTLGIVELDAAQSPLTQTLIVCSMERVSINFERSLIHRSTNLGQSWALIDSIEPQATDIGVPDPVIVCDPQGWFYMIVMRVRRGNPFPIADLECYRSIDDGQSWTLVSKPHENEFLADYPQFLVRPNSDLYLSYTLIELDAAGARSEVVFKKSSDAGLSWTPKQSFALPGVKPVGPDIAFTEGDTLRISYGDDPQNRMLELSSPDFGITWPDTVYLPNPDSGSFKISKQVAHPTLTWRGILAHKPHQQHTPIIFHRWENGSWQSQQIAVGAYAEAIVDPNGELHIIYNERKDSVFALQYLHSDDGGLSFDDPEVLYTAPFEQDEAGEYQSFLRGVDGNFYLSFCDWSDASKAKMLVFSSATINTDADYDPILQVYPNPFVEKIRVIWETNTKLEAIRIIDLQGKVVGEYPPQSKKPSLELDLFHLPPGQYHLLFEESNRILVKRIVKK